MPRKPTKDYCLASKYPEIAKLWHPTKNKELTPFNVTPHSGEEVWWKCDKKIIVHGIEYHDHEFKKTVHAMTRKRKRSSGSGCPMCAGRKKVLSNCLATTHPEIAKEWHPTKNKEFTPFNVSKGGTFKSLVEMSKGNNCSWG